MDESLSQLIREENKHVHRLEAPIYEKLHPEIFNWYEQRFVRHDLRFMESRLKSTGGPVLDVGCGTGNIALKLAAMGHSVDAIDISEEMLSILKSQAGPHINLIASDINSYLAQCQKEYDVITFSSVLHHLPDFRGSLAQTVRRLKTGGFIYITHEPLTVSIKPRLHRYFSKPGEYGYTLSLKLAHIPMGTIDYTLADYHVRTGIDDEALVSFLQRFGLMKIRHRRYATERADLIAFISNQVLRQWANMFALIFLKE